MEQVVLGDSLFLQDRFHEAAEHYRQVSPLSPEAAAHLALCLLYLGDSAGAQAVLDQLQGQSHPALSLAKAKVLFYSEQFAASKEVFAQIDTLPADVKAKWVRKCELAQSS